jgi:hypothetical protein
VPRPTNESNADTLPDPELNPLLNPLLAAHMGRWAEVYFTNPPEKRGQAVAELIRELETLPPPEPVSIPAITADRIKEETEIADVPVASYAVEPLRTCGGCGYENSAEQKFCGMCGAPLQAPPKAHVRHVAEAAQIPEASWREPEYSPGGNSEDSANEPVVSVAAGRVDNPENSAWTPQEELPSLALESEPVPYRYRRYVAAALSILLVLVLYMAWRGTKAISGAAGPQSAPSRAVPASPAAASAAEPSGTPSDARKGNPESKPPASAIPSKNQPEAVPQKNQTAEPASRIGAVGASSPALAAEPNGAEELATAENYLNGRQGVTRDRGEAAQWLWKAVRKENAAAALALSDLYLRGDGVPKNCEQARVLLDAAARKGVKAAAERLRNLQAFGCQ